MRRRLADQPSDHRFSCSRPLADIAADNPIGAGPGRLPLLVEGGFTTYVELDPAVIELNDGCAVGRTATASSARPPTPRPVADD